MYRHFWDNVQRWRRLAAGLERRLAETLRKFKSVAKLAGRLIVMHARASERLYAPGGLGFAAARDEFVKLAGQTQPQQLDHGAALAIAGSSEVVERDAFGHLPFDASETLAIPEMLAEAAEQKKGGSDGVVMVLGTCASIAAAGGAFLLQQRAIAERKAKAKRKADISEKMRELEEESQPDPAVEAHIVRFRQMRRIREAYTRPPLEFLPLQPWEPGYVPAATPTPMEPTRARSSCRRIIASRCRRNLLAVWLRWLG